MPPPEVLTNHLDIAQVAACEVRLSGRANALATHGRERRGTTRDGDEAETERIRIRKHK
jgi:hypothetical protein